MSDTTRPGAAGEDDRVRAAEDRASDWFDRYWAAQNEIQHLKHQAKAIREAHGMTEKGANLATHLHYVNERNKALAAQVTALNNALNEKNKELDALHYVWCDGGCESGAHRYDGKGASAVDEEVAKRAVRSLTRIFRKHGNMLYRRSKEDYQQSLSAALARIAELESKGS